MTYPLRAAFAPAVFAVVVGLILSQWDGASADVARAKPPATRPVAAVERAIVVSIDGLRPDLLLRANSPNLRRLMQSGSYTMWARTVAESITLPSHASMLTGVSPQRHGVLWNTDIEYQKYPNVPTIFDLAKKAGLSTAMVTGKTKFTAFARPGSLDWQAIGLSTDEEVGRHTADILRQHRPRVAHVHFAGVDAAGHGKGWGSPEQIAAIENIDRCLGIILDELHRTKLDRSTLVIISADHGGAGKSHGPADPRSRHIPWIASGPGIRADYDLTLDATLKVNTVDTFATVCHMIGLVPEGEIDGKPVLQILEERELLQEVKK